jgi:flagellar hook-basal body complex protein FliE
MKIESAIQSIQKDFLKSVDKTDNSTKEMSFADFLNSAIKQVDSMQKEAEQLSEDFALGLTDNIQQVMIASEKASMAMQLTMQIRNKVLDAYQEIMRMSI